MTNTFFISDTHFGHKNIITFTDNAGKLIRPFDSVEEMDETMVENWNKVVKADDKVYHLGDVAINQKALPILDRLNGRKTLVAGNHDIFYTKKYKKYFENIRGYKMYPKYGIVMSHIPIHPAQLEHRFKFNVHGHLHSNHIMLNSNPRVDDAPIIEEGGYVDCDGCYWIRDKRYLNICVEQTNFTPINFEEVLDKLGIERLQPDRREV